MDARPPQVQFPDTTIQFTPPPQPQQQLPAQQPGGVRPFAARPIKAKLGCFSVVFLSLTSIVFGAVGGIILAYVFFVRPPWATAITDQISFIAPTPQTTAQEQVTPIVMTGSDSVIPAAVEKAGPAVVSIIAKISPSGTSGITEQGIGTGFIVNADGLILTNKHVVEALKQQEMIIVTAEGKEYPVSATNIAEDSLYDLAVIKIEATNLPVVTLGNSSTLKVGQQVIAIGLALGEFQNTVTVGVVSGIGRTLQVGSGVQGVDYMDEIIQTDASINPGNSGGPLLNTAGEVIAINTAKVGSGENLGFAIPINSAKSVLENYQANSGKIVRPRLGVSAVEITKLLALRNALPFDEGAYIAEVQAGSPAEKAGLLKADIVTQVDGSVVSVKNSLRKQIQKKAVGDKVVLTVKRGTEEKKIEVVLE